MYKYSTLKEICNEFKYKKITFLIYINQKKKKKIQKIIVKFSVV